MKHPKVLFFDIETTPVRAWVFRTGEQYIDHEKILTGDKFNIICIGYKWGHEKKAHVLRWSKNQSSVQMIKDFEKIVNQADLVIGHNVDKFDIKMINAQRLIEGLPPILWPTSEDTLKQFRKHFYLPSHRLDYLSKLLGGTGKDKMHFQDWVDIRTKNCPKALNKMMKYCKRDVLELERVYNKAQKHFKPKLLLTREKGLCPRCTSNDLIAHGISYTSRGPKQRYSCKACDYRFVGEFIKG